MLINLLYITGYLLTFIGGITFSVSAISYFLMEEVTQWIPFFISGMFSIFLGIAFILGFQSSTLNNLRIREIFLLTFLSWLLTSIFSSLPFMFSNLNLSFTDACFETVSAITTTGATVLKDIHTYPKTILLWRSLLQWLGGIGIVIMAMTILPTLKIGGMQLFQSEFSDQSEKALPKVSQVAQSILKVYVTLTVACIVILWCCNLSFFDAVCHGFTTISTGGLSNYDDSIGHFKSAAAECVMIIFMLISSLPLITFVNLLHRKYTAIYNSQIITYITALITVIVILWIWVVVNENQVTFSQLRSVVFMVVSMMSTTGFVTMDYQALGSFAAQLIVMMSIVGACTGSTSGGIKIFRLEILSRIANAQIKVLRTPHGVFYPSYQGKIIDNKVVASVIMFLVFWVLTFVSITLIGSAAGLDLITAVSGAVSTVSNVGIGLGDILSLPGGYAQLPTFVKWSYIAGMLLGRLEFITILALASRSFWRN